MKKRISIILAVITAIVLAILFLVPNKTSELQKEDTERRGGSYSITNDSFSFVSSPDSTENKTENNNGITKTSVATPISDHKDRVTKKPFGIEINPENSPVQPERFSGFHTGTDFEVNEDEIGKNVDVFAICDGNIIRKDDVSGYGGIIIQQCEIEEQSVTVLYGHISLQNTLVSEKAEVSSGDKITILGEHESDETDGERKHLHVGIHKGNSIELRGYVETESELEDWINIEDYL